MRCRLEKINHNKNQKRFYELEIVRNLFGEWCLYRHWGRLGTCGGQERNDYFQTNEGAQYAFQRLKKQKSGKGYSVIPVQLELFDSILRN